VSPDPSVHADQLVEIEKQRASKPRRWRPGGCALLFFLAALFLAAAYLYVERETLFEQGAFQAGALADRISTSGKKFRDTPPRDLLEGLRGQVGTIQEEWESLTESGEIHERLGVLREELGERRDMAKDSLRSGLDELTSRSQVLVEKARELRSETPVELGEIMDMLRRLELKENDAGAADESGSDEPTEGQTE
jgi:hypothetical protein